MGSILMQERSFAENSRETLKVQTETYFSESIKIYGSYGDLRSTDASSDTRKPTINGQDVRRRGNVKLAENNR